MKNRMPFSNPVLLIIPLVMMAMIVGTIVSRHFKQDTQVGKTAHHVENDPQPAHDADPFTEQNPQERPEKRPRSISIKTIFVEINSAPSTDELGFDWILSPSQNDSFENEPATK